MSTIITTTKIDDSVVITREDTHSIPDLNSRVTNLTRLIKKLETEIKYLDHERSACLRTLDGKWPNAFDPPFEVGTAHSHYKIEQTYEDNKYISDELARS